MELLGDTEHSVAAVKEALAGDGAALLRGLLPRDAVDEVGDAMRRELTEVGWLESGTLRAAKPAVQQGEPEFYEAYRRIWSLEVLHRLAHHPNLFGFVEELFGEPIFNHLAKVARMTFPSGAKAQPTRPHQDMSLLSATTDLITCWIPLVDVPRAKGGLKILRGSQNGGLMASAGDPGAFGIFVAAPGDDDPAWATADYEAGDVLLFHNLTVHAALPNTTDELRLSLDTRYQAVTEPLRPFVLNVHLHPPLPDWDEITAGWESTEWVAVPDGLTLVPNPLGDMPLKDQIPLIEVGPSRFVRTPATASAS